MPGDHLLLVGRDRIDAYPAAVGRDARAARSIRLVVKFNAEPSAARADALADLGRALADAGGEHEAVEAAEHRSERTELAANPPDKQIDRLRGLSGLSNDVRDLLASDAPSAHLALDYFVYRIAREAGALAAAMGGIDGLVFTAGIGENSPDIRARVCARLQWLGVRLDEAANGAGGPRISTPGGRMSAWVIPTDEERMIAEHTLAVVT